MSDSFVGIIREIKVYNGWGIGKAVDVSTGERLSIKGNILASLHIGGRYKFIGQKSRHEKFGDQFDVAKAEADVDSLDALVSHMVRNYTNINSKIARAVADFHQGQNSIPQLRNALIHNPSTVDFSQFTDKEVKLKDDEASQERRVFDSLSIRFSGLGIPQTVMNDLGKWLFGRAIASAGPDEKKGRDLVSVSNEILDQNPYRPITKVDRYAFGSADMIAGKVGIARDDPKRIGAIVCCALSEGCNSSGHMWLTQQELFKAIRNIDPNLDPATAVNIAIEQEEPVVIDGAFGRARYYSKENRRYETNLTSHLAHRLTHEVEPLCKLTGEELEDEIDRAVAAVGKSKGSKYFILDESQRDALRGILTSRCSLHTLTAGPGCGKTAIVEVLMETIGPRQTTFCAPIGKAAKVLNTRIKKWGEAKTIHSTLEFQGSFKRNHENQLESTLIIADEQSMLGGPLGSAFFDAINSNAHIIMLGDPGQLAPIEPGRVLKSILDLEGFDHHRLSTTHRNKGAILSVVNEVGSGSCKAHSREDVIFSGSLPPVTIGTFNQLARDVQTAAEEHGGLDRVGVICPVRKGNTSTPGWNVTYLNAVLRDAINPDPDESKKVPGTSLRLEDRIIVGKNMVIPMISGDESRVAKPTKKDVGPNIEPPTFDALGKIIFAGGARRDEESAEKETYVVNGDTGWLDSVEMKVEDGAQKPRFLILRLDDDRLVKFPAEELDFINLAYAITVHAAQGSEYGKVFGVVTDGHEQFMHRAMIFTMFSRAQRELTIFGDQETLSKIAARPAPDRNCALTERVMREVGEIMGEKAAIADRKRQKTSG